MLWVKYSKCPAKYKDIGFIYPNYLIANQCHPSIMRPSETDNGGVTIINKLNRPPPFVFNPNENYSRSITWRQLLIWLIPAHQRYLKKVRHFPMIFCLHVQIFLNLNCILNIYSYIYILLLWKGWYIKL